MFVSFYLCLRVFSLWRVSCSFFFFFKQKTAYEMRISDWSSDVCSSDLQTWDQAGFPAFRDDDDETYQSLSSHRAPAKAGAQGQNLNGRYSSNRIVRGSGSRIKSFNDDFRSEEHTSELQSLLRISYAVFCLKKKNEQPHTTLHQLTAP